MNSTHMPTIDRNVIIAACMQVRECLVFSAQLRLPSNMTTAEKSLRVDSIIEELVSFESS